MKELVLISPKPGAGVNTIAVNLAVGLARLNYRVLIDSMCEQITRWLTASGSSQSALLDRNPGLIFNKQSKGPGNGSLNTQQADYLICLPRLKEEIVEIRQQRSCLIMGIIDRPEYLKELISLNQYLQSIQDKSKGIDIIVPNKIKPGDWDSIRFVDNLAKVFGYNKIADSIPFCEAIHDLPDENKSVWDLPRQYSNRQAAFQSLVEKVVQI